MGTLLIFKPIPGMLGAKRSSGTSVIFKTSAVLPVICKPDRRVTVPSMDTDPLVSVVKMAVIEGGVVLMKKSVNSTIILPFLKK